MKGFWTSLVKGKKDNPKDNVSKWMSKDGSHPSHQMMPDKETVAAGEMDEEANSEDEDLRG